VPKTKNQGCVKQKLCRKKKAGTEKESDNCVRSIPLSGETDLAEKQNS
jgi:hypothetical protein